MRPQEVLSIFSKSGALLNGHFVLSSGLHSGQYLQCALVLQYPEHSKRLCEALAAVFKPQSPQAVVGPAYGGIIVSYEVASALGARSLFTERENGKMTLRRDFSIRPGERVLVVEDVVTTGTSVKEVIDVVKSQGGHIIGVGAIIDRSQKSGLFGDYLFNSLVKVGIKTFRPDECPFCKQGISIAKPGSR